MKMIKLTAKAALMAIVMACTAACSDDEGNTNVAPVFPEQTVQAVQAGTESASHSTPTRTGRSKATGSGAKSTARPSSAAKPESRTSPSA